VNAHEWAEVVGPLIRRECCWRQDPDLLTFIRVTFRSCLLVASAVTRHSRLFRSSLVFRALLLSRLHAYVTSVHCSNAHRDRTWDALTSLTGGALYAPLLHKHKTIPHADLALQQPVVVSEDL